eukprot:1161723-Pelagomonas_calceolata.AAC.8
MDAGFSVEGVCMEQLTLRRPRRLAILPFLDLSLRLMVLGKNWYVCVAAQLCTLPTVEDAGNLGLISRDNEMRPVCVKAGLSCLKPQQKLRCLLHFWRGLGARMWEGYKRVCSRGCQRAANGAEGHDDYIGEAIRVKALGVMPVVYGACGCQHSIWRSEKHNS